MTELSDEAVRDLATAASGRGEFWGSFVEETGTKVMAEVGVFRGDFAARLLAGAPGIVRYFMIDPWRHLDGWNKPANKDDATFERFYEEAMRKTDTYADRRVVLRGRTTEVIEQVGDGELDLAYVDGDHTLRGITIDLMRVYPKVREGGWIGGDDFSHRIFQHGRNFEPTLVFPYAVYFAEAVGARIVALPHRQFLVHKSGVGGFQFVDLVGKYGQTSLKAQLGSPPRAEPSSSAPKPRERSVGVRQILTKLARR